ncbi:MAG: flavodoxin family protein [Deltaproteobacteria bacterium]|jgi:multimeric flavodoxin WrbA|nr:flavodoxin family protein [Deltaproteobacteria bacterium]
MTVLAVNGSPRPKGNTSVMIEWCLEAIEDGGLKTEVYQVGGKPVLGCKACYGCARQEKPRCVQKDFMNELIAKAIEAEALILASPVYFADLTPELKAVIDRLGYVSLHHGSLLARKPGAAVVVARRAGHVHTFDSINHFFGINQMLTVGSRYWNLGVARDPGEIQDDREAQETMRLLGANIAWLVNKLKA